MSAADEGVTCYLDLTGLQREGVRIGHSQRATTSSRRPGVTIRGAVSYRVRRAAPCPDCGGLLLPYGPPGPHATRWAKVAWEPGEAPWRIDCLGRRVP